MDLEQGYPVPQTVLLDDPVRHHIVREDFSPYHRDQACPSLYSLIWTMNSALMRFLALLHKSSPYSIKAFVELCDSFILMHTGQNKAFKMEI